MYLIFFIFPLIIIIPLTLYFYFYFKRIIEYIFLKIDSLWKKILLMILSFLFVLPVFNLFGFWTVVVLHLFFISIIIDIIHWFFKDKYKYFEKVYQLGMIPILCVLMILGYAYFNMQSVSSKEYTIYTKKNINHSYKIALITDLHFGNTMNQEELQSYCHEISQQNVDIVLLGGDIVDERSSQKEMQQAFETLGKIKTKKGIYYVYGNHDRASHSQNPPFSSQELAKEMKKQSIYILSDESVIIDEDFILFGREDKYRGTRKEAKELLNQEINQSAFLLMLDHQPVDLKINDDLGYDLQLSGHTHGGQMFPVGFISDWLGFGEMNYGYKQLKYMQVIVSSGIAGWGYPLRTGSHSEYVIVNIIKK
ncbi:MAG: metallophosphoesterase [Coprobacillus sp.]|nr:metallophosphoesterase [Coprobacillus sp.]